MPLKSARLRIENDGAAPREYRVVEGQIEVRRLSTSGEERAKSPPVWHRLTPEQLSIHVDRNTVVARWLEHRIGWRNLLRACTGQDASHANTEIREEQHSSWN
jgi:hypothetical protein